jgi:hypothetical protein
MKSSSLRRTTLLSILGLSSAQSTSSWGEPFTVDNGATSSQETLLPSSAPAPPASVSTPLVSDAITSIASEGTTSLSASIRGPPPIQTGVPRDSSFAANVSSSVVGSVSSGISSGTTSGSVTGTTSGSGRASSTGSAGSQSTGGAMPVQLKKMGVVGAMAGAAGVLFV